MIDTRRAEIADAVARYPAATWYLRLPIIRHLRALIADFADGLSALRPTTGDSHERE